MLYLANGRRFVFWCDKPLLDYMYPDLIAMNVDVDYIISDSIEDKSYDGKVIKKGIDLFYEDKEDVFVFVALLTGHADAYKQLSDMGFKYGSAFGSDFYICALSGGFDDIDVLDNLLGINRFYGETLGFKVYGNPEDADLKVMIFGGSTTDPTVGWNVTWPEVLYNMISKEKKVCVYNGAIIGNIAIQMFQKFLRDGLEKKPDIVITFDGLNDTRQICCDGEYPFLQKYQRRLFDHIQSRPGFAPDTLGVRGINRMVYGTPSEDVSDAERYICVHRWFNAICQEYEIQYYGFFQPVFETGNVLLDEREKALRAFIDDNDSAVSCRKDFTNSVLSQIKRLNYMHDLSDIFDNKYHMYYDFYHSTDEGHKVIAQNVYDRIFAEEKQR